MLYEFKCENTTCEDHDIVIEEDVKLAEIDTTEILCPTCGEVLTRLISFLKTKHRSWGTWRV